MNNFRFYLWLDDGPRRLPLAFLNGRRAYPQFAHTTQRVLEAVYQRRGNKLFLAVSGTYASFDAEGKWAEAAAKAAIAAMDLAYMRERIRRMRVADLKSLRDATAAWTEHVWKPSEGDRKRVTLDLLPANDPRRKAVPLLKGR